MNILEINTEKTWRGGERQTLYGLEGFRSLGHKVELLCLAGFPLHEKATAAGFTCHTVNSTKEAFFFLLKRGRFYNILHTQTSKMLTYCLLSKPFHKSKVVLSRRLDFVPSGYMTIKKYQACDSVICVSKAIQDILSNAGIKGNTIVIPECVEEKTLNRSRAEALRKELHIENKIIIATTSALVQHKDPLNLVEAVHKLRGLRQDFILLHFGDGPLRAPVEEAIKRYQLDPCFKLMGFVQNVEDYFSIFDYFVMSSEEEGLGSSILDAFIYKVPVISTNAGGLNEMVSGRGYVVPKKNSTALAEGLNHAMTNKEENKRYTDLAYQFASSELTVKAIHEKHLKVFEDVLRK